MEKAIKDIVQLAYEYDRLSDEVGMPKGMHYFGKEKRV